MSNELHYENQKIIYYHYDQVVITAFSLHESYRQLIRQVGRNYDIEITISSSKNEGRSSINMSNPPVELLQDIYDILNTNEYLHYLTTVEFAKDVVYPSKQMAEWDLFQMENTIYRKYQYDVAKIEGPSKPEEGKIGSQTLYFVNGKNGSKIRGNHSFKIYVRNYKQEVVLRYEISITHHKHIKRISHIDTIEDLIEFDVERFIKNWFKKNIGFGRINHRRAISDICGIDIRKVKKDRKIKRKQELGACMLRSQCGRKTSTARVVLKNYIKDHPNKNKLPINKWIDPIE